MSHYPQYPEWCKTILTSLLLNSISSTTRDSLMLSPGYPVLPVHPELYQRSSLGKKQGLCSSSPSFSVCTSKQASVSLWGIETVNAPGFDVPLLCEPSQSSACACLPCLHHLIHLCGGEGEGLWNSFTPSPHTSLSLPMQNSRSYQMPSETTFLHVVASSAAHGMPSKQGRYRIGSESPNAAEPPRCQTVESNSRTWPA